MSDETRTPAKQPYARPKLVTYGNIATLTQAPARRPEGRRRWQVEDEVQKEILRAG